MSAEIETVIKGAIAAEEMAHDFYRRLAQVVSHADTKDTFEYLAKEELEHKHFLESCFTPAGCKLVSQGKDTHLAELLESPAIAPDMSPKEALVVAMKQEEVSHRFYQALAALQPPGEIRDFLEKMAKMELAHKAKMEYLYDNTAFPEVWYES
ncbi:MAG: ferritin family protein [Deltaproteobacteria bacterium]|nr:ferritin family protein [Deltaproteobacteria bacterium]